MTYTVELRASNEPPGTDHTGEIISFSAVGSGGALGILPRPWVCYTGTINSNGVEWQFPDGTTVPTGGLVATGDQLITRVIGWGVALSRGPTHNSPDGEHCCVVTILTLHRGCVSPSVSITIICPMLTPMHPSQLPAPH